MSLPDLCTIPVQLPSFLLTLPIRHNKNELEIAESQHFLEKPSSVLASRKWLPSNRLLQPVCAKDHYFWSDTEFASLPTTTVAIPRKHLAHPDNWWPLQKSSKSKLKSILLAKVFNLTIPLLHLAERRCPELELQKIEWVLLCATGAQRCSGDEGRL